MTMYSVYDNTTKEHYSPDTLSEAKKWMKERAKLGHEVSGSKTKVWSNGEWEPAGEIKLAGSNKFMMANTRQTKPGY